MAIKMHLTQDFKTRKEYVEYCKLMIKDAQVKTEGRFAHQYKKSAKGQRQGVVCAYMLNGALHVGASRCNSNLSDRFDPYIGLWTAIRNSIVVLAKDPETYQELQKDQNQCRAMFDRNFPSSLHKLVCRMIFRSRRQFGLVPREPKSVNSIADNTELASVPRDVLLAQNYSE